MKETEIQFRKKREIGDIYTDSFQFIKQEHKPLSKLIAVYVLPFMVLYGFVQIYLQKNVISKIDFTDQETLFTNIGPIYLNIFLFSLFGLFVQSLLIAAYYTYIDAYVKKGKGNFDLADITPQLFSNGLLAIGASLVIFIVVIIGLILCIVPGIYFANSLSLAFIILIFEKKGLGNALMRSTSLVNTQWWSTFLINITGIILIWTAGFVMSIPAIVAGFTGNVFDSAPAQVDYPEWYWVMIGISTVVSSVLWIIPYTFLAMQYFNLEERMNQIVPGGNQ
ncbi:MAG: hypothetical protein EP310_08635 [Bacteroidetes bacterium]|nr:MAG: hypothetical protein EP310_08635 [Bacteroidota bacterium]